MMQEKIDFGFKVPIMHFIQSTQKLSIKEMQKSACGASFALCKADPYPFRNVQFQEVFVFVPPSIQS